MNRRRMPLILALTVVLVVAALCWLVPLSKTSQAAPAPSGEAAFKGKVLFVYTGGGMMGSFSLMEKAQVQKIGDRLCLVGKGAGDGPIVGRNKGRTVWLPMEHIVSITEFDDVKDAKKAMKSGGGQPIGGFMEGTLATSPASAPLPPAPVAPPPATVPKQ